MGDLTAFLSSQSELFHPRESLVVRATRHLNRGERRKLFSTDIGSMRTAEGRWYEAVIYETFLEISQKNNYLKYITAKGADAPKRRARIKLGQNGFYYSRSGDITIRGNGQDLAEFDILLIYYNNQVVFAEVITSPSDLKEFEIEIEYKKRLLGYLFSQYPVYFILVSSIDISNSLVVRKLLKSPENAFVLTDSCEQIKVHLMNEPIYEVPRIPFYHPKVVYAIDISIKTGFDYLAFHNKERDMFLRLISDNSLTWKSKIVYNPPEVVKKVLFGALFPSAVKKICENYKFTIKGECLSYQDIMNYFSKVVLAMDLPDKCFIIYLRSKQRKEYLKMVQDRNGIFKFERYTPSKVGFFLWLEALTPTLGSKIAGTIIGEKKIN